MAGGTTMSLKKSTQDIIDKGILLVAGTPIPTPNDWLTMPHEDVVSMMAKSIGSLISENDSTDGRTPQTKDHDSLY